MGSRDNHIVGCSHLKHVCSRIGESGVFCCPGRASVIEIGSAINAQFGGQYHFGGRMLGVK